MVGAPKMPPNSGARTIRHKIQAASGKAMPQTLFDKIWQAHMVARRADGRDLIYIDRHVLHELHAPHAFEQLEKQHGTCAGRI